MNIVSGEPVPPGFEDEVNRLPEIQPAIDQYKGNALVGLEYTLELHEDDRREPGYFCILCDKRGDPRTIMQHWTSLNHRLRYLEKHFPSAVREFNPVKYKPNSHQILISIVQRLVEAIEDHHGRLKLTVCNSDDFRRLRGKFVNEINNKYHHDERSGPNFVNFIDHSLWENIAPAKKVDQTLQITIKAPKRLNEEVSSSNSTKREDLDEISSDSDGQGNSVKKAKKREQSPAYRVLPRVRRSPPFEEDRGNKENKKKLPTPKELSLQASHIAQEKYKWEKYRCMVEIQLKQMEKIQEEFDKNPEKHPLYPEEWKKFWNRRYKELQAEKKTDPNKYDYKPEWIAFWTKRMKDLFNVEVEKKKKEIKVKLGLPEDAEETVDQLKEKYKVQVSRNAPSVTSSGHILGPKISDQKTSSGVVIDISDDESPGRRRGRRTGSRSRSRSRRSNSREHDYKRSRDISSSLSKSPISDEYNGRSHYHSHHHRSHGPSTSRGYPPESDYYYARSRYQGMSSGSFGAPSAPAYRVLDSHQYPKYERSPSPNSKSAMAIEPEPEDEGPLTVVAVLRLLTALEEHLGSLGPKVVDLLGKALALEKVKANSADDLLLNEDHCVFFETIKEKLKGLLIADVVEDQQKVRAVKKAIKNIAAAIHQVTSKGTAKENKTTESANVNDCNIESRNNAKKSTKQANVKDLPFDRQMVATKLAAALVLQGREDVSTEDMDKLIFMFILTVKLSKSKVEIDGSPLQMKDILPELGIRLPSNNTASINLAALPAIVDELFENSANSLVQNVDADVSNDVPEKETKNDANSSMLESLTDSDLQTLLQNFKHLSSEEQHHLIAHLKKLETADPSRVEKLRKFVNLADLAEVASKSPALPVNTSRMNQRDTSNSRNSRYDDSPVPSGSKSRGNISDDELSDRRRAINVSNPNKFSLDDEDEDDDYNVEDVFKAAFSKVGDQAKQTKIDKKSSSETNTAKIQNVSKPLEPIVPVSSSPNALTFNPAGLNISLSDTQNLIANLMGSLQQSNSNTKSNIKLAATNKPSAVESISTRTLSSQQHSQAAPSTNMSYYQQSQQQSSYGNGFNSMSSGLNNQGYYNNNNMPMGVGNYNNNMQSAYSGYQPWGNDSQQYGMQNMSNMQNLMSQQQQQQQQQSQHMGYNMYGRGAN